MLSTHCREHRNWSIGISLNRFQLVVSISEEGFWFLCLGSEISSSGFFFYIYRSIVGTTNDDDWQIQEQQLIQNQSPGVCGIPTNHKRQSSLGFGFFSHSRKESRSMLSIVWTIHFTKIIPRRRQIRKDLRHFRRQCIMTCFVIYIGGLIFMPFTLNKLPSSVFFLICRSQQSASQKIKQIYGYWWFEPNMQKEEVHCW